MRGLERRGEGEMGVGIEYGPIPSLVKCVLASVASHS